MTILLQSATIITKCHITDFESTYNILLDEVSCVSRYNRHTHNTLILLYKIFFLTKYPIYTKIMFNLSFSSYNLRGNYILTLPVPKTTTYGLHFFSYHAAKQFNLLPDSMRTSDFAK